MEENDFDLFVLKLLKFQEKARNKKVDNNGLNFNTIVGHTVPDSDVFFASALLILSKNKFEETLKKVQFYLITTGDGYTAEIKGGRIIDRGLKDLDHHGIPSKTSFDLAVEELKISGENWIQTPKRIIYNAECKGISLPFDINEISKVIGRTKKFNDREKMEKGIKVAYFVLLFHREKMERNIEFTVKIIRNFFESRNIEMPERFKKYVEQLENPFFQRPCDFVEVLSAANRIKGEEEAKRIGEELLQFLLDEYNKYKEAKKGKTEKHFKIRISELTKDFIVYIENTDNPKDHVVALEDGACAIYQRNPNGNSQIFFNSKIIRREVANEIIRYLRCLENMFQGRELPPKKSLTRRGTIPECPEWHYFLGESKGKEEQGIFIFNGSLTAPDVPKSKIPPEAVITIIVLVTRDYLEKPGKK